MSIASNSQSGLQANQDLVLANASSSRSLPSAKVSPAMVSAAARIAETLFLFGSGVLVSSVVAPSVHGIVTASTLLALTASVMVATATFQSAGLYRVAALTAPLKNAARLLLDWSVAILALATVLTLVNPTPDLDTRWLVQWYLLGIFAIGASRYAILSAIRSARRSGRLTRNAIVYGSGGSSRALVAELRKDQNADVRICGVFDDRSNQRGDATNADAPRLGDLDALKRFARSGRVDILILALPLAAENRVSFLAERVAELPIDVRLAATSSTLRFHKSAYSYIGSVPVIDISERPISGWSAVSKWIFDKTIATIAIILLAPVMALVAMAVKLESKGPVIFRQKRYGFNNELIEVYKFRSMYTDCGDSVAAKLVTKDDPRVTRVGRIIRKASIDELPQLFNVIFGSLSLVGPRPHAIQAKAADRLYPDVVDGYFARHKVKPGITGWAQINGWRGETDTFEKIQKRVEFDLDYIENWSVWLDFRILAKTPKALLATENAY